MPENALPMLRDRLGWFFPHSEKSYSLGEHSLKYIVCYAGTPKLIEEELVLLNIYTEKQYNHLNLQMSKVPHSELVLPIATDLVKLDRPFIFETLRLSSCWNIR